MKQLINLSLFQVKYALIASETSSSDKVPLCLRHILFVPANLTKTAKSPEWQRLLHILLSVSRVLSSK
jgi:hypothetical protein